MSDRRFLKQLGDVGMWPRILIQMLERLWQSSAKTFTTTNSLGSLQGNCSTIEVEDKAKWPKPDDLLDMLNRMNS